MQRIGLRTKLCAVLVPICLVLAAICAVLPARIDGQGALAAVGDEYAARLARNASLVVKYDLDEVRDGKLAASKWDAQTQSFVADTAADATVENQVQNRTLGAVTQQEGVEGGGALGFSGSAHARASFYLPADASGMTISIWVKNISTYWGALIEFWDGTHGGRLGKGTMQGDKGRRDEGDAWDQNCAAHAEDVNASVAGGGWDSFVVTHDNTNNDNGGEYVDHMTADTWYQVTYVLTATEMKAYRDGVLKQEFKTGQAPYILGEILTAAKNQTDGKLGIRLGLDDTADRVDILDDLRIYNGAMTDEQVQSLYGEYKGLRAFGEKTVKLENVDETFSVAHGSDIYWNSTEETFPKILIGETAAEAVTEQEGTWSATGEGFSYSYTVGEYDGQDRTAIVTYTDTASEQTHLFGVTQHNESRIPALLTSLNIVENGVSRAIEGFAPETRAYSVTLSPDVCEVRFEVTVEEGGTSDVDTVNTHIYLNGANVITTTSDSGVTVTYTVTLSRGRADTAMPTVDGRKLTFTSQIVYTDDVPAELTADDVVPTYPNGSEVQDFSYASGVATFKLVDKVLADSSTDYRVTYREKSEGHIAHWSYEESADNKVFGGERWDAEQKAYVKDDSIAMTVRKAENNVAVTDSRDAVAATKVGGVMGDGIELPGWGYTTAKLPAQNGTTGFTFSTWMKTEGIVWEAIFAVLGETKGTILEKGHMQTHNIENGDPVSGWDRLENSTGVWLDPKYTDDDSKKPFFNTPSAGASYVFFTVTVTYENGVGTVYFYKDGQLAVKYENDEAGGGNAKARVLIDALNKGASVGLHRHHLDGGSVSRFDETNVYAYALTAEEIAAAYESVAELLSAAPEYVDAKGLSYPELLLGGATSETVGDDGVRHGVTAGGVAYSYKPQTAVATPALDAAGVTVTLSKNGMSRITTVKFRRDLGLVAETLGYRVGDDGEPVSIPVPTDSTDVSVTVGADVDLSDIRLCDIAAKKLDGDDTPEHYTAESSYNATTHIATVRLVYTPYPDHDVFYTVTFAQVRTGTLVSMRVTGGRETLTLTKADAGKEVPVSVASLSTFRLNVSLTLEDGAVSSVGTEKTLTAADLAEGKFVITVTSEDGTSETYTLVPVVLSADATLKSLTAGDYPLSFDAATKEYELTVADGEEAKVFAAIVATPNDAHAAVVKAYDAATGTILVTVTAEDGLTTETYSIVLKQAQPPEPAEQSGDTSLSLTLEGTAIVFGADGTAAYTAPEGTPIGALSIETAVADGATVSCSVDAENNRIVLTVTAENGTQKVYTVTVAISSIPTEGGCGSSVVGGGAMGLLLAAAGLLAAKKRKLH